MKLKDYLRIFCLSLFSRIFYIGISFMSSYFFSPYDKSTNLLTNSKWKFLLRWDAINFYEIAKNGYTSEHLLAFFPLYSYLIRLFPYEPLITGILISNTLFILSSLILFYLSNKRYDTLTSYISLLLFLFNPSSIIYSTLYSESLFLFLFLICFLFFEEEKYFFRRKNVFFINNFNLMFFLSVFLGLTSIVRSNGILFFLFGYFYFPFFCVFLYSLPFVSFQVFSYIKIQRLSFFVPYSYIQKKYWDQGFLKFYFDTKNIPNVLISLPFLSFAIYLLVCYYETLKHNLKKELSLRDLNNRILITIFFIQTVMALFFIHSQIFFRFVSFNPLIYWSIALMIKERGIKSMALVVTFYFSYSVTYALLFGAYYPPA